MTHHKLPGNVKFVISDNGDPSVGIYGSVSYVETYVADEEHLQNLRETLRECFDKIHDARTYVRTEQEIDEDARAEEAAAEQEGL